MPPRSAAARNPEHAAGRGAERDPRTAVTRLLVALLLLALAALWWWSIADDPGPLPDAPPAAAPPPSPPPMADDAGPVQRTMQAGEAATEPEPAPPAPAPVDLEHPWTHTLTLRLVDRYGLPVPEASVYLAPIGCTLARWPASSDARGELTVEFAARQRAVWMTFTAVAWGETQAVRRIECDAEHPATLTVVMRGSAQTQDALEHVRRRDLRELQRDADRVREGKRRSSRASRDELDILCGRSQFLFRMFECVMCHDHSTLRRHASLAQAPLAHDDLHPQARFWEPVATMSARQLSQSTRRQLREADAERKLSDEPEERGTQVSGTVLDASGKPAADQPVAAMAENGSVLTRTLTDSRGRYKLGGLAAGRVRLVAGGAEHGRTETELELTAERQLWNGRLELQSVVRGFVRDQQGAPLVGWLVEFERDDGHHADLTATDGDGRFLLPDAFGQGTCRLWRSDGSASLPVNYGVIALPDTAPLSFDLAAGVPVRARLRISPLLPAGFAHGAVEVRVVQLDTGCCAAMPALSVDDSFEIEGLPPGPYVVEFGAPVLGFAEAGPVHVDGRGLWDLGRCSLPTPGRLRVVPAPGEPSPLAGEHAFYHRTDAFDVRAATRETLGEMLEIRPGRHLLLWRTGSGVHAIEFEVLAGITTTLHIPRCR